MATLVGTQAEFHDALYELCELDYDAIEAYEAAINRLDNEAYKTQLTAFRADHQRHVQEIKALLIQHQQEYPDGPSSKQILAQGKVVLANMFGDEAILRAMISNEEDTNEAYKTMNEHPGIWPDATDILRRGLEDEIRHKTWLERTVGSDNI